MVLWAVALLSASGLRAQSTATVKAVDVYRSQWLTPAKLKAAAGAELELYLRLRSENKRSAEPALELARAALEKKIRELAPVAAVRLSFNEYAENEQRQGFLTIDVVDAADAPGRLTFAHAPSGHLADPGGALETWRRYAELGESLSRAGKLVLSDRPECPGLYCSWGSPTPELAALEKSLAAAAVSHKADLRRVLSAESDPRRRAAAMYALSYSSDGRTVADAALDALRDPSEEVRAAALLVLADVALYHKAFYIEAGRVIPALDYPTVSDRAKALAVVGALAANKSNRTYLVSKATPYLAALLRLRQPANHDLAYTALATLSQQNYGQRDFDAWDRWVETHATPANFISGVSAEDR